MSEWIFLYLDYMLDIVKIYVIFKYILGFNENKGKKLWIFAGIMLGVASYAASYSSSNSILVSTYLTIAMGTFFIMFKEKKRTLLVTGIGLIFVISSIDTVGAVSIALLLHQRNPLNLIYSKQLSLLSSFITVIIFIGLAIFCVYKDIKIKYVLKRRYFFFFAAIFMVNTFTIVYIIHGLQEGTITQSTIVLYGIYAGATVIVYFQVAIIVGLALSQNFHKKANELGKKYLNIQKEHFRYLKEKEQATIKFRHDIKNHILVIENMVKRREINQLEDYLVRINNQLGEYSYKVNTNNEVVNAIINKYYQDAEKHNIELDVKGRIPNPCKIDAFDLCIIFSNILSNAIEAVMECEKKIIKLRIRYDNEQLYIVEENEYKGEIKTSRNGKILTSKMDENNHGIGLENVMEAIRKNEGFSNIECTGNTFKLTIALPVT